MKEKIFAVTLFIIVIGFVIVNTIIIKNQIESTTSALYGLDIENKGALYEAEELFIAFEREEKYISLTVNHEDLTNIKDCFVEMIGYLKVENTKDAYVTKNRLIYSLEHLRRISGFTLDAII